MGHDEYTKLALPIDPDTKEPEVVSRIFAGRSSQIFIAESGRCFIKGRSREHSLPNDREYTKFEELKLPPPQ